MLSLKGLVQISDSSVISKASMAVIEANRKEAETYRKGRTGLLGYFVGLVVKSTNGRADPRFAGEILRELLEK